ncbi:hypothetical protein SAMN04488543_1957 [Friedmanniella luteola]|uniref:Uncharacterized protein n=1 Tax=Friedmanniella luteola TaxID=546871 RepID=A0A1H1T7B4_9ACTN|nr:hypothetical protein [Friedmanniella luteola]SDS55866.1 hypothetical protein SAMN04488543_1957 [Friedmanniella luteola]
MPTIDRAMQVAAILRRIHVDAREEMRSCEPLLVVEGHHGGIDEAVLRIEPTARLVT